MSAGTERRVWVDTCCINKRSGAELSETISSISTSGKETPRYAMCTSFATKKDDEKYQVEWMAGLVFTRVDTDEDDRIAPRDLRFSM